MILFITVIIFVFTFIIFQVNKLGKSPENLPPGPKPLPILGNVHQTDFKNLHLTFDKWTRKYGDVVYARFLGMEMIILGSFEAVKEAFVTQGDIFAARPDFWIFTSVVGGHMATCRWPLIEPLKPIKELNNSSQAALTVTTIPGKGYANSEGQLWKEQRRHGVHVLRDMGLGRGIQEEKIIEETAQLFAEFDKPISQKPKTESSGTIEINPVNNVKCAVINIINNILFGKRFPYGDSELTDLQARVTAFLQDTFRHMPMELMPVLRNFPWLFGQQRSIDNIAGINAYFTREVAKHEATFDDNLAENGRYPSDFVYAYLQEIRRQSKNGAASTFSKRQLHFNLFDLFTAGFETTATALSWFILYMVSHPTVQEKMRKEIQQNVSGPIPHMSDKLNLPYCCAVLAEVQRHANIVPFGVSYSCFEDATIMGYHVPKRSFVVPNLWIIMRDERLFRNSEEFIPDRFIDPVNRTFSEKVAGFMPFSIGKRACMGEGLARMELLLFATALVARYEMKSTSPPNMTDNLQFTLVPEPFSIQLRKVEY